MTRKARRTVTWAVLAGGAALALGLFQGPSVLAQMVSQGMMGGRGSMMGSGMMGGQSTRQGAGNENPAWTRLADYVHGHNLSCLTCHAYAQSGTGPAFRDIAHRYAGKADAAPRLAKAISDGVSGTWRGYAAMPGGLATRGEAHDLAQMILRLGG